MRKIALFIVMVLMVLNGVFAAGGGEKAGSAEAATQWPNKPITLLCGFSAGGSSDLMVRFLAPALEKQLGQPVVVVNKPGSGGWVMWTEFLHNTKADGYTFALINTPGVNMGHYDPANPRKDTMDDFDLLCNHVTDKNIIAIRNDETRFKDMPSLIAYAKNNTILSGGTTTGIMGDDANCMTKLQNQHGIKFQVVATGGAKETETMFISKNTDILVANVGDVRVQALRGEYKVLCVFSDKRSELLPDVPTYGELGYEPIINFSACGYAYPKGVDPKIKAKMLGALEKAIKDPMCKDKVDNMGAETDFIVGDAYYKLLENEIDSALKAYGLKKN
jgi:tripartite-type tricarboxylate transporter receptor subunit TctC